MRTTDDPWPEYQKPLGEKVIPPKRHDPEWKPLKDHPGVEVNPDGKVRTNLPIPKVPRWFP